MLDQPGYDIYAVEFQIIIMTMIGWKMISFFYDSDTRYLTDEEVKGLSLQVVCYAKNEICQKSAL